MWNSSFNRSPSEKCGSCGDSPHRSPFKEGFTALLQGVVRGQFPASSTFRLIFTELRLYSPRLKMALLNDLAR